MERELKIKKNIMRRVYFIYAIRFVFSRKAVKFIPAVLLAAELTPFLPFVSLRNVVANMPNVTDLKALYSFEVSAFMNTELVIQVSIVALVLVLAVYLYNMFSGAVLHSEFLRGKVTG